MKEITAFNKEYLENTKEERKKLILDKISKIIDTKKNYIIFAVGFDKRLHEFSLKGLDFYKEPTKKEFDEIQSRYFKQDILKITALENIGEIEGKIWTYLLNNDLDVKNDNERILTEE